MKWYFNRKADARIGFFQFGLRGKDKGTKRLSWYINGTFWPFGIQLSFKHLKFEWRTKRLVELRMTAGAFAESPKWYGIF